MKDDLLREATRALREEADASRARPDETRARVMRSLKAQRARRLTTVRVVVPLAAVLVGSVAWASAARWFPGALHDLASQLGLTAADPPDVPPAPPTARRGPRREAPAPPDAPPPLDAPAPPEEPPPLDAPMPPEEPPPLDAPAPPEAAPPLDAPAPAPPMPSVPVVSARAPRRAAVPAPPPTARAAPRDAALSSAPSPADNPSPADGARATPAAPVAPDAHALYQAAHRAHFVDRNPAAALAAWDTYLAAAPRGRFALEAQYNRALCLVRLGRTAEARQALEPFARGAFGGYRQAESRSLLEVLSSDGR